MRVLGLVLAGALVLTAPLGLQAGSLGPGYHPMPNGWNGDWRRVPGPSRQWNGGPVSPRWCSNCPRGGWVPYGGPGVPTYWVYVPGSAVFDYRFADWRGPTGSWGNP